MKRWERGRGKGEVGVKLIKYNLNQRDKDLRPDAGSCKIEFLREYALVRRFFPLAGWCVRSVVSHFIPVFQAPVPKIPGVRLSSLPPCWLF